MSQHVSSTWYEDFFTELPNEFWRRAVPPEATTADVAFIERTCALAPGARVLDVPCGSGRHALMLAARGHRVTGIDLSHEAIGHARRAAAEHDLDVTFIHADIRDIPRGDTFDAAVCMGNSFGYLDPAGTRVFLAALAAAIRPEGHLVIDFSATAESILLGFTPEPRTMRTGDIAVTATNEYDIAESRLISTYRFTRGSWEHTATALHHIYTTAHVGRLLVDAGFTDLDHAADTDGAPFTLGAGRLLLTARRGTTPEPR